MDWLTLLIELIGIAILLLWIVLPIREFRQIFARIRRREHSAQQAGDEERHSA